MVRPVVIVDILVVMILPAYVVKTLVLNMITVTFVVILQIHCNVTQPVVHPAMSVVMIMVIIVVLRVNCVVMDYVMTSEVIVVPI